MLKLQACAGEDNAFSIDSLNDMKAYNNEPDAMSCCGKASATLPCRVSPPYQFKMYVLQRCM